MKATTIWAVLLCVAVVATFLCVRRFARLGKTTDDGNLGDFLFSGIGSVFGTIAVIAIAAVLLVGCTLAPPASPPSTQYKPQVVDTACAWDAVVLVPKVLVDYMSTDVVTATAKSAWTDLEGQILAHDREWRRQCSK